jgi:cytochrome c biogenesis protein CcmG, thiol:disulfide interchange protein DsbE
MIAQQHDEAAPAGHGRASLARNLWRAARNRRARIGIAGAFVLVVIAIVAVTAGGRPAPGAAPLPARNFSLARLGQPGATVSLAAYAGRPVIVNFFASWCAPCQRETPLLARYYASQHGRVVVLGVDANDQTAAALQFVRKAAVAYPVGFDPFPAATTTSYRVYALPQTFFLDAQHRIVAKVMGPVTARLLTRYVALMNRTAQNRG